jgi:hypothetical protein
MRKKILDTLKHPILSYPKDNKNSSWTWHLKYISFDIVYQ